MAAITSSSPPPLDVFQANATFKKKFSVVTEAVSCVLDWASFIRTKLPVLPTASECLGHVWGVSRVIDVVRLITKTIPQATVAFVIHPTLKAGRAVCASLAELIGKVCKTVKKFLPLIVAIGVKILTILTLVAGIALLIKGVADIWIDIEKLLHKVTLAAALTLFTDSLDTTLTAVILFTALSGNWPLLVVETLFVLGLMILKYYAEEKQAKISPSLNLLNSG